MSEKLSWTDVQDLGYELYEAHPKTDPLSVRFTELRELVEALPTFEAQPGQSVNEQILEAIQAAWYEEVQDAGDDDDDDDDSPGYTPPVAFKPQ